MVRTLVLLSEAVISCEDVRLTERGKAAVGKQIWIVLGNFVRSDVQQLDD